MITFTFDIETIPNIELARSLYDTEGLSDTDVAEGLFTRQRQKSGTSFLPLYLHKIIAISVVLRVKDSVKVWSLGDDSSDEKELVTRFFDGIAKYTPTLVSWNGKGFDMPVIHMRALKHSISAPTYWDTGEFDNNFKWNNYLNRFHARHTDVMDLLANHQIRANAPLDTISSMLGFPGKMGMSGAKVWGAYCDGELANIRNYCETDVLNTYLVYLKLDLIRGHLSQKRFDEEIALLKTHLTDSKKAHLEEFCQQISN